MVCFLLSIDLIVFSFLVVNCVQCHPFDCAVATSGIDNTIKVIMAREVNNVRDIKAGYMISNNALQMWTPHGQVSTMVAGVAGPVTADVLSAIEINQRKLRRSRETILYDLHTFSFMIITIYACMYIYIHVCMFVYYSHRV